MSKISSEVYKNVKQRYCMLNNRVYGPGGAQLNRCLMLCHLLINNFMKVLILFLLKI